jgi:serine beta-lactamase-like protein LACTB
VVVIVARVAIGLAPEAPIHKDAAAVPSSTSVADTRRYSEPVEESRRLARAFAVKDNLPGLSLAVAFDGDIVWAEGFGRADVEGRVPVTPLTRFRLGALSKPLTATAAALLHDQGRLDLDAPVQRYAKGYPEKQWKITTRQVMGDVAGVHRIRGDSNDAMPNEYCTTVGEAVAVFANEPLLFEPGTQHRYSIYGWVLMSAVVEGASGEPFGRFMTQKVFEPLTMDRTVAAETDEVDGMTPVDARTLTFGIPVGLEKANRPNYTCLPGANTFLSTPTDLVKLGSAMLKPGFLKAETIEDFRTPTRLASGQSATYAMGWTVSTIPQNGRQVQMVSHRGSPRGGTASLLTFPELGLAVAAATNITYGDGLNPFARQIAEVFAKQRSPKAAGSTTKD